MLDSVLFLHFQMWDLTTALEIVSKQSGETTGECWIKLYITCLCHFLNCDWSIIVP